MPNKDSVGRLIASIMTVSRLYGGDYQVKKKSSNAVLAKMFMSISYKLL